MSNRQELANWLQAELNERKWNQSELARVSGLHRAIISKIMLQGSDPKPETLEAIAKAFKLPPAQVYRIAGILPQDPEVDEEIEQMLNDAAKLSKEDQQEVLAFIRMKLNRRKKK